MPYKYLEKNREYMRKYRKLHPDKFRESQLKYKHSIKGRIATIKERHKLRDRVIFALGSRCVRCGFNDKRALQIDHLNGNGTKERKKYNSLKLYYLHVLKNLTDYQLLCANCNWIKRSEKHEYPHSIDYLTVMNINSVSIIEEGDKE